MNRFSTLFLTLSISYCAFGSGPIGTTPPPINPPKVNPAPLPGPVGGGYPGRDRYETAEESAEVIMENAAESAELTQRGIPVTAAMLKKCDILYLAAINACNLGYPFDAAGREGCYLNANTLRSNCLLQEQQKSQMLR